MHYVLVTRDDRYWLVGPFCGEAAAAAWGSDRINNPEDDPRWQVIRLSDPGRAPRIVAAHAAYADWRRAFEMAADGGAVDFR